MPTTATSTPQTAYPPSLLADDATTEILPGQLRKSEFLDQLDAAVRAEADAALAGTGRSTQGCPYLAFWIGFYRGQSSEHVERALRRYVPEARAPRSAEEYVPLVAARVRRSVEHWAQTGAVTGVPDGVPGPAAAQAATARLDGSMPEVRLKARAGDGRPSDEPAAVRAELGRGRPLESSVRSRMEQAFGRSFSRVRLHTDATASRLSSEQNALAFTVGEHVAFGAGEYRPGSPVGDALIAHELAHVVQQGSGGATAGPLDSTRDAGLETDADRTAAGVLSSLYGGVRDGLGTVTRNVVPSLRTGLRLQRCPGGGARRGEVRTGPTYSPRGTITPTLSGGMKTASFTMAAEFKHEPAKGIYASCCEVRQYIQWSKGESPPNHAGFQPASSYSAETWYEDRDEHDKRYGHRAGTYSDPGPGDQYLDAAGNQDQANGHIYSGSDSPQGAASRTGEWRFELKVIDTCNGDRQIGGTDHVTIDW